VAASPACWGTRGSLPQEEITPSEALLGKEHLFKKKAGGGSWRGWGGRGIYHIKGWCWKGGDASHFALLKT